MQYFITQQIIQDAFSHHSLNYLCSILSNSEFDFSIFELFSRKWRAMEAVSVRTKSYDLTETSREFTELRRPLQRRVLSTADWLFSLIGLCRYFLWMVSGNNYFLWMVSRYFLWMVSCKFCLLQPNHTVKIRNTRK